MAKLKCNKCNFKWTSKTANIPRACPYCDKEGGVYDTEETGFRDVDEILTI
jgi:predicted Zn-ribbon and HTH transcriptional regulator